MKVYIVWLNVLYRLGVCNVLRNLNYRLKLKFGVIEKKTPIKIGIKGDLFLGKLDEAVLLKQFTLVNELALDNAALLLSGSCKLFFHEKYNMQAPPVWHYHPEDSFSGHWSNSPVNKYQGKDIKLTWDLSRFNWLQQLSCAYSIQHEVAYLDAINSWFKDWNSKNPINSGVNWACGQECSIRVIHVLNSTIILEGLEFNRPTLVEFVVEHCKRIESTIGYAISQDNNHATSEAAALFICGGWLLKYGRVEPKIKLQVEHWLFKGRSVLEERVLKLVLNDGGFCMYSTNYHRVLLNTISIVEFWRNKLDLAPFSESYISKCQAATKWLYLLVDSCSGETLNLGANDGSNPFIVQSSDYRDYRPSVQFAAVIFFNEKLYSSLPSIDEPLTWLGVNHLSLKKKSLVEESSMLKQSGLVILRARDVSDVNSVGYIKFPSYMFRPNQADLLHFDLWVNGENILRDGGSYSYNCEPKYLEYFSSIKAHNTVEIDEAEPMPRLGPFLLGNWRKMKDFSGIAKDCNSINWQGTYVYSERSSATHSRQVNYTNSIWTITDYVNGASECIILRWRLKPDAWVLIDNCLKCENIRMVFNSKEEMSVTLKNCFESRYYDSVSEAPLLELKVESPSAVIFTHVYIG